jgi:hypothetical protein
VDVTGGLGKAEPRPASGVSVGVESVPSPPRYHQLIVDIDGHCNVRGRCECEGRNATCALGAASVRHTLLLRAGMGVGALEIGTLGAVGTGDARRVQRQIDSLLLLRMGKPAVLHVS